MGRHGIDDLCLCASLLSTINSAENRAECFDYPADENTALLRKLFRTANTIHPDKATIAMGDPSTELAARNKQGKQGLFAVECVF